MTSRRRQVLAIADHLGMPWRYAKRSDWHPVKAWPEHETFSRKIKWSWDGVRLIVTPDRTAVDVLHELGHWFMSDKPMRARPEFGLGDSVYSDVEGWQPGYLGVYDSKEAFPFSDEPSRWNELGACAFELLINAALWPRSWRRRARYLSIWLWPRLGCRASLLAENIEPVLSTREVAKLVKVAQRA